MSSDFKPMPTSLGSLLGGAGGYALAHFSDMDSRGKALMSAAGAALGGGLGYLGGRTMSTDDVPDTAVEEARQVLRNKNIGDRIFAATATGATGAGLAVGASPFLAERHHKEMISRLTRPHKEWGAQVAAKAHEKLHSYVNTLTDAAVRAGNPVPTMTPVDRLNRLRTYAREAAAELAATRPDRIKVAKVFRKLRNRRNLYQILGLTGALGAAGLASWLAKDNSLYK